MQVCVKVTRPSLYVTKTPTKTQKHDKISDNFFHLGHGIVLWECNPVDGYYH